VLVFLATLILAINGNGIIVNHATVEGAQWLLPVFLAGSLVYIYREYVPIDARIVLVLAAITIISQCCFNAYALFLVTTLYALLVFGASGFAKKIKLPGDYSYGIYIYGFLVQQIVNNYLHNLPALTSMLITVPATILLGVLSWHFIEGPIMNYAHKVTTKLKRPR
jgi:peptidoglycan/LPS O-acetylase OafA/YrhL